MARPLAKLARWSAYSLAALVILLAILIGLFRLLLPQLPEYQAEIQARLSETAGLHIEFESLDARWRLRGPELLAREVTVQAVADGPTLASASEVIVGISLTDVVRERKVVPDRILLQGVNLIAARESEGWELNGWPIDALPGAASADSGRRDFTIEVEDAQLTIEIAPDRPAADFEIVEGQFSRDGSADALTVAVRRRDPDGRPVTIELARDLETDTAWTLFVKARDVELSDFEPVMPASVLWPTSGQVTVDLWADIRAGTLASTNATLGLNGLQLPGTPADGDLLNVEGKFEYSHSADLDLAGFDIAQLSIGDSQWEPASGEVRLEYDEERQIQRIDAEIGYADLGDINALLRPFSQWVPEVAKYELTGVVRDTQIRFQPALEERPVNYRLEGRLQNVGISGLPGERQISGLTAAVTADDTAGSARFNARDLKVVDPSLFAQELSLGDVRGGVTWRSGTRGIAVLSDELQISNDTFSMLHDFELLLDGADAGPRIDLKTEFRVANVAAAVDYLPVAVMRPKLVKWFRDALISGALDNGELRLVGGLRDFPFDDGNGEFLVRANFNNGSLLFNGRWPAAEIASSEIVMEGMRLFSNKNVGELLGNAARNVRVEIPDLRKGLLRVDASGESAVSDGLELVRESPIRNVFGDRIDNVSAAGRVRYTLDLDYPIPDRESFTIAAAFDFDSAEVGFAPLTQRLSNLSGRIDLTRETLSAEGLQGSLLGTPVELELLRAAPETGSSVVIVGTGILDAESLRAEFSHPAFAHIEGTTTYRTTVRFPTKAKPGITPDPLSIRLESDLVGWTLSGPAPLAKQEEEAARLQSDVIFADPETLLIDGNLENRGAWQTEFLLEQRRWQFNRAGIALGGGNAELPVGQGLFVSGQTAELRLTESLDFVKSLRTAEGQSNLFRGLDLKLEALYAYGQKVSDIGLQVGRNANDWLIQTEAETLSGAVFVPLDLQSGRPIILNLDRLYLVESDPVQSEASPEQLPPVNIRAADFRLGEHRLGALEASLVPTEQGIETQTLATTHPDFSANGSGRWVFDSEGQQITALSIELTSSNTRGAAEALGIDSTIDASVARATMNLSWPGAPRKDFWEDLDGSFTIAIENGRLDDVDPGAGRVLGLMSIVELPRRLALDFRDVFAKGLSFDALTADYRIVNGEAYTCNLTLEGPAADIALIGRTGLAKRNYNQTAVVRPKVGNTLPAVGAVMGGPQVAAALLLVSRIFKRPLQDIGQAYYQINGSWDEPRIERTNVERFYATGQLADCLQPAG